jgi:O-antigen ligase
LVTGIGWGNISFYLRPYYDPKFYVPLTVTMNSGYFQILLEGGLFGLLATLWFLGGPLLSAHRNATRGQNSERRGMLTTTLAVCVVIGITHAFFSADTQIWVFWGLLISLPGRETLKVPIRVNTTNRNFGHALNRETVRT